MKTIIEQKEIKVGTDTQVTFRIIGEAKKGTMEVPVWEKTLVISDLESAQQNSDVPKLLVRNNALQVFDKFYEDLITI